MHSKTIFSRKVRRGGEARELLKEKTVFCCVRAIAPNCPKVTYGFPILICWVPLVSEVELLTHSGPWSRCPNVNSEQTLPNYCSWKQTIEDKGWKQEEKM